MAAAKSPSSASKNQTMAVSTEHPCDWKPRGGTEAGKQWQFKRYGGTLASQMAKDGTWRCTGCGQFVQPAKKL